MSNQETDKMELKAWKGSTMDFLEKEVPNIYINSAKINFNTWDATISFGEIADEKDGKLQVNQRVKVKMSLSFLKAFQRLINDNVKALESNIGAIQELDVEKLAAKASTGKPVLASAARPKKK